MERYAPHAKDLASRDVVSRSMTIEIREGRGVGPNKDHIFLHLEHLDAKILHERLPGISETARIFSGVDVTREPIPVLPTCHYNMGGIPTNYRGEALTKLSGDPDTVVRVDGDRQAACLVHGANRLGSTRCSISCVRPRRRCVAPRSSSRARARRRARRCGMARWRGSTLRHQGGTPTAALRLAMQKTMQSHCAVFRTAVLRRAWKLRRAGTAAPILRQRPLADLEQRPDGDAGARQSLYRPRWPQLGVQPHREPRCPSREDHGATTSTG
jgi:succinate dehydrogenase / fumarate reductase flavoprotein subunit